MTKISGFVTLTFDLLIEWDRVLGWT